MNVSLVSPTGVIDVGIQGGGIAFDEVNNLTWLSSGSPAQWATRGAVESFASASPQSGSFSFAFPPSPSSEGLLFSFDSETNTTYFLSNRALLPRVEQQLLVVNTSAGSSRTLNLLAQLNVSVADRLVSIAQGHYVCLVDGCINTATGESITAPRPANCTPPIATAYAIALANDTIFIPCGGLPGEPIGYTYQPLLVRPNTSATSTRSYGATNDGTIIPPFRISDQWVCGCDTNEFVMCFSVAGVTISSAPLKYYGANAVPAASSPHPAGMTGAVVFIGQNATEPAEVAGVYLDVNGTVKIWMQATSSTMPNGLNVAVAVGSSSVDGTSAAYVLNSDEGTLAAYCFLGPCNDSSLPRLLYSIGNVPSFYSGYSPLPFYVTPGGALMFPPASNGNLLLVFDATSGALAYNTSAVKASIPAQSVGSALFFVGASGNSIVSLDMTTGTKLWTLSFATSSPVVGFIARQGTQSAAVVDYVQLGAFVQTSVAPLPGARTFSGKAAPSGSPQPPPAPSYPSTPAAEFTRAV